MVLSEYQKEWRIKNKEKIKGYNKKYTKIGLWSSPKYKSRRNLYTYKAKLEVIDYYSHGKNECACCGEKEITFLTLDHIQGKGRKHRKEVKASGGNIYLWIKRNGFPEGFQILCYNCNCGRYRNGGICPHKLKKININDKVEFKVSSPHQHNPKIKVIKTCEVEVHQLDEKED